MVELWDCSLLIPLNVCRRKNNFKPWECDHERHTYEKCVVPVRHFISLLTDSDFSRCQYDEYVFIHPISFAYSYSNLSYVRRMKDLAKQKREALSEDS